jgi:hypothetical protein
MGKSVCEFEREREREFMCEIESYFMFYLIIQTNYLGFPLFSFYLLFQKGLSLFFDLDCACLQ